MAVTRFGDEGRPTGDRTFRRVGGIALAALILVLVVVGLTFTSSLVENVSADTIMVVQAPLSGKLTWYATTWGLEWQGSGTYTKYPKRGTLPIELQVRFNDGGHGTVKGSVQYDMPLDEKNLTNIHTKYGSPEAVQKQLIETVVNKAVYMTGPLMSSKESYAERRNDLISYIEDQISNGVYRTRQREVRIKDPLTDQEKTAVVTEIVVGADGNPARQEASVLREYGVRAYNFSIKELVYDPAVEKQIQQQQSIAMDVQTAIANARKAEQNKLTIEQQGLANVAQAKYEQEVIKQKAVTQAEQQLAVATLDNKSADQYREATLKRADADATYRRRIMEADGALEKKLATYVEAQKAWAAAFAQSKNPVVPNVVMGGNGSASSNAAASMMDLMGVKFAHDLALDFSPRPVASHGGQ